MTRVLEGKLAIITGASRGIGVGIAKNLAGKGANVVLNYTSTSSTESTKVLADEIASTYNVRALAVQADMAALDGASVLIAAVKEHFAPKDPAGSLRIDIIVHNAGVALNNPLGKVRMEDFEKSYNVNVRGPLLLMQAAEEYLPTDRSGRVICVSSTSATTGLPNQSVYGGTKAAIEAMARTWARELSERATVNSVCPGPVGTDMWWSNPVEIKEAIRPFTEHAPLARVRPGIDSQQVIDDAKISGGRPGTVEEVAGVIGMLCTPDASWVTGQVVSANGGFIFSTQ